MVDWISPFQGLAKKKSDGVVAGPPAADVKRGIIRSGKSRGRGGVAYERAYMEAGENGRGAV